MIQEKRILSLIVLSILILTSCKPDTKRTSTIDPQSSTSVSVQQQAAVRKRVNVINNLNQPLPKDPLDKERIRVASEWLDAAEDVARKSHFKDAQNIATFIRANGIISKPYRQDLLVTIGF